MALVMAMVFVGGVTRLTGSGLSITEWNVVTGSVPPLNAADWDALFLKYQASPQFLKVNAHFGLSDFQRIFWWEWIHRQLGRVVGLVFLIPLAVFALRKQLKPWLVRRSVVAALLIGFQGLLGWLMGKSGLVDEPTVSHFRLAAHLVAALVTLAYSIFTALRASTNAMLLQLGQAKVAWVVLGLLFVQIVWGAFVAGLKGGLMYSTFPTMEGYWIAPEVTHGGLVGLVAKAAGVQWVHRWLGVLVLVVGLGMTFWARGERSCRGAAYGLAWALIAQFGLGIATILWFYRWPVVLGSAHQMGAMIVVALTVHLAFRMAASSLEAKGYATRQSGNRRGVWIFGRRAGEIDRSSSASGSHLGHE